MKKALFLVGGPGSGKDIILKDIMYNYGLKEFTLEQINNVFNNPISENDKKYSLLKKESIIISTNAYRFDDIKNIKTVIEDFGYSTSMIFVDVSDATSKSRLSNRKNITEEKRREKLSISKHNIKFFENLFEDFMLYNNDSILETEDQLNCVEDFCEDFLNGDFKKLFETDDEKIIKKFSLKKKLIGVPRISNKVSADSVSQDFSVKNSGIGFPSTVGPNLYSETYAVDVDSNMPAFSSLDRGVPQTETPKINIDTKKIKILKRIAKDKYKKAD